MTDTATSSNAVNNDAPRSDATVAAQLTPTGRSAIAVVIVAGPRATDAVGTYFHAINGRRLPDQPVGAVRFGRWGGRRGEEVVVCRRSTDDGTPPRVEIHCHGGRAAVRAVLDDLVAAGCVEISWREWLAISSPYADIAEAQVALAEVLTERAAGVMLDQLDGAMRREIATAFALIERGDAKAALSIVETLLARVPLAGRLTRPWQVVIGGPPNVGKSRLLNALVGYERAVVYDQPGTTRDVVTATTAVDGWPVEFSDTAGLRDADDSLEAAGIELTRQRLAGADLVIVVAEAVGHTDSLTAAWRTVEAGLPSEAPRLRVVSKADLLNDATQLEGVDAVVTSAATGDGVAALLSAIGERLVPTPPPAGGGVPIGDRQVEWLSAVRVALVAGDHTTVTATLQSLLAPRSAGNRFEFGGQV